MSFHLSNVAVATLMLGIAPAVHGQVARVIRVPEDQRTIQAAIDSAQTGDVVLVSPGTYVGQITITKAITLASEFLPTGDERFIAATTLDGGGGASVIEIPAGTADRPTIQGFTIQNGDDGIAPHAPFNLLHCLVRDTADGVDFENGSGGLVQFSTFERNRDDGLDLDHAVDVVIADNIIRNNGNDGIEIRLHKYRGPTLQVIIRNNIVSGNDDGIQLIDYAGGSDRFFLIEENLIHENNQAGLGLMDDAETDEDFRAASVRERIHLFHNTFVGNDHGLTGGDNVIALNNLFVNTTNVGIKGVNGSSITAYNLFWNNGIDIQDSNNDTATTWFLDPLLDTKYHPRAGSPAIDAGTASFAWAGDTVLRRPRGLYRGNAPDLGRFEFDGGAARGPIHPSRSEDLGSSARFSPASEVPSCRIHRAVNPAIWESL